ncbi:hypothetical protein BDV95DRAFT_596060 [Massariosphaeria phaeospora]|uniref:Uncharacterized protein n=1 Tax=Massariosphaeria phaeospora TaxID=100035 RepID=A0A7C8M6A8_9PLEO|nr:hypothetical protein BDV95DRAFT_596060 [Massariosphaeria phaeospora]
MVLQEVGGTSQDSFTDNPYPSADDPYASTSSSARFDASDLTKPIPILGPLLGFSQSAVRFRAEQTIKYAERKLSRSLTLEEAQALAGHLYRLESDKSWFSALGASIGGWRWLSTRATNKFPLVKPKPNIDANKFLFIKGPMAQLARQSTRLVMWMTLTAQVGKILGQSIAQPAVAKKTSEDPKLEQFRNDLKMVLAADTVDPSFKRIRQLGQDTEQALNKAKEFRERSIHAPPGTSTPTPGGDDMSPTAGTEAWPADNSASFSDSYSSPVQAQDQRPASSPDPWGRQPTGPNYNDDASPTGGLFQDEVQSQSSGGGSAWDHLRRGGAPVPGQRPPRRSEPPRREQRESSTVNDGFGIAETDDERKQAQRDAQRKFDEMLDKERKGQDSNNERNW